MSPILLASVPAVLVGAAPAPPGADRTAIEVTIGHCFRAGEPASVTGWSGPLIPPSCFSSCRLGWWGLSWARVESSGTAAVMRTGIHRHSPAGARRGTGRNRRAPRSGGGRGPDPGRRRGRRGRLRHAPGLDGGAGAPSPGRQAGGPAPRERRAGDPVPVPSADLSPLGGPTSIPVERWEACRRKPMGARAAIPQDYRPRCRPRRPRRDGGGPF